MKTLFTLIAAVLLTGCSPEGSQTLSSLIGTGADIAASFGGSNSSQIRQVASSIQRATGKNAYSYGRRQTQLSSYTPRYDGRHILYYDRYSGNILRVDVNPHRAHYLDPVMIPVNTQGRLLRS